MRNFEKFSKECYTPLYPFQKGIKGYNACCHNGVIEVGCHPLAAGLPSAEELKEVPRLAEATTEVVRPEMPECVGSQLMKLRIGDEI